MSETRRRSGGGGNRRSANGKSVGSRRSPPDETATEHSDRGPAGAVAKYSRSPAERQSGSGKACSSASSVSSNGSSNSGGAGGGGAAAGSSKSASHDSVRRIVQEEGRAARNLIAWSVPLEERAVDRAAPTGSVSSSSGTPATVATVGFSSAKAASSTSRSPHKRLALPSAVASGVREASPSAVRRSSAAMDDASRSSGSRASSAAGGRKADLRARYWAFLFDNLKRAVDEIYRTCESDESVDECKEVMLMLEQCIKDFRSLISQWTVMKEYEFAEESGKRPTSLAWDLRKTSPGKPYPMERVTNACSPATVQASSHQQAELSLRLSAATALQAAAAGGGGGNGLGDVRASRCGSGAAKVEQRVDAGSTSQPVDGHGRSARQRQQQQQQPPPLRQQQPQARRQQRQQQPHQSGLDSPRLPTGEPPADTVKPSPIKPGPEDIDGWETVRRSKAKASPCSSVASLSSGSHFRRPATDSECSHSSETATQPSSVFSDSHATGPAATSVVSAATVIVGGPPSSLATTPSTRRHPTAAPAGGRVSSERAAGRAGSGKSQPARAFRDSGSGGGVGRGSVVMQAAGRSLVRHAVDHRGPSAGSGPAVSGASASSPAGGRGVPGDASAAMGLPGTVTAAAAVAPVPQRAASNTASTGLRRQAAAPAAGSAKTQQSPGSGEAGVLPTPSASSPDASRTTAGSGGAAACPLPNSYRDAALGRRPASARQSHSEPTLSREQTQAANHGRPSDGLHVSGDSHRPDGDGDHFSDGAICASVTPATVTVGEAASAAGCAASAVTTTTVGEADASHREMLDDNRTESGRGADAGAAGVVNIPSAETVENEGAAVNVRTSFDGQFLTENAAGLGEGLMHCREDRPCDEDDAATASSGEDADDEAIEQELEEAFESAQKEEDMLQAELSKEQDQALESAMMAEASYLEEIERAEEALNLDATDVDLMATTGSTDADSLGASQEAQTLDWDAMVAQYDAEHERKKALGLTWGDMVDDAEAGSRTPGRGAHLHEKLSSPSRKRSITESKRRYEERQEKARELREKFYSEKTERLKELFKKVEEVRAWKEELLQQKRLSMESKLQSAEAKRSQQLRLKVKKAHEEDNKAQEIAFINSLEAQNKRHEILSRHQGIETRLQDRQGERQKRIDEKAAKEQAAEDRRRAIGAERAARLLEMQEKRRQREEKIGQQLQEREKERAEAAKVREREHRDRLAAIEMQQQTHIRELQRKIQHKQEESARRHDQNLQQIREKAFVMSIMKHSTEDHNDAPELVPYDTKKLCVVCNVLIPSEVHLLSHLRGKKHAKILKDHSDGHAMSNEDIESFNLEHIKDAPGDCPDPRAELEKERQKTQKKRCKKLRQRMVARGNEYEASFAQRQETVDSPYKAKISKAVKDIAKYLQTEDRGPWPQGRVSALERSLGELIRVIENKSSQEQTAFRAVGGFSTLCRVIQLLCETNGASAVIPFKCGVNACNIIRLACKGSYENCHHILFSNRVGTLIDLLLHRLTAMLPDSKDGVVMSLGSSGGADLSAADDSSAAASGTCTVVRVAIDAVAPAAMHSLATLLSCLAAHGPATHGKGSGSDRSAPRASLSGTLSFDAFASRTNDVVSYMVSTGIIDKLHRAFTSVRGPLDAEPALAEFIQHGLNLLTAATRLVLRGRAEDPSSDVAKSIAQAGGSSASSGGAQTAALSTAPPTSDSPSHDATGLMQTFAATEFVGIVSLLYCALLGGGRASLDPERPPPELPAHTIGVVATGLRLLNQVAGGHLAMLQSVLGEESMSLQFRHIASHLISYCMHYSTNEDVLHETILCVGYFSVLSPDNQALIQTGQPPTVLQRLCLLPFQYFSDPRLVAILFPTLIACCYESDNNRKTVEQELSCVLLANYVEEQLLETQKELSVTGAPSSTARKQGSGRDKTAETDVRVAFAQRFPRRLWKTAQEYFAAPLAGSS